MAFIHTPNHPNPNSVEEAMANLAMDKEVREAAMAHTAIDYKDDSVTIYHQTLIAQNESNFIDLWNWA